MAKSFRARGWISRAFSFLVFVGSLGLAHPSYAADQSPNDVADFQLVEDLNYILMGDEGLQTLVRFRQMVEASAKETTFALCRIYRYGTMRFNHSDHAAQYVTVAGSFKEWERVVREGFLQVFSGMFGTKANYLDVMGYGMFDLQTWVGSLYTMYLVSSPAFVEAASHCLHTVNLEEIQNFANTILFLDYEPTILVNIAAFGGVGKLLSLAGKGMGILWKALRARYFPNAVLKELWWRNIKRGFLLAGGTVYVDTVVVNEDMNLRTKEMILELIEEGN